MPTSTVECKRLGLAKVGDQLALMSDAEERYTVTVTRIGLCGLCGPSIWFAPVVKYTEHISSVSGRYGGLTARLLRYED